MYTGPAYADPMPLPRNTATTTNRISALNEQADLWRVNTRILNLLHSRRGQRARLGEDGGRCPSDTTGGVRLARCDDISRCLEVSGAPDNAKRSPHSVSLAWENFPIVAAGSGAGSDLRSCLIERNNTSKSR